MCPEFSETLLAHVRQMEGCVLHPYLDRAGVPTIGYGHVIPSMHQPTITQDAAEALLCGDLRIARKALLSLSPSVASASQARQDALTDFIFNVGPGAGRYATSTLRRKVESGDWLAAATEMRRWVYAHDTEGKIIKLPGLVRRRGITAGWLERG